MNETESCVDFQHIFYIDLKKYRQYIDDCAGKHNNYLRI